MTTSTPKTSNGIAPTPRQGIPKGSGIAAVKPDLGTPGLGSGPGPEAA